MDIVLKTAVVIIQFIKKKRETDVQLQFFFFFNPFREEKLHR